MSRLIAKGDLNECEQFIQDQIIKQISKIIPSGIISSLALSVILVFSLKDHVIPQNSLIWLGLIAFISLLRLPSCYFFLQKQSPQVFINHGRYLLVGIALSGLTWGSTAYFLFAYDSPLHQALHIVVLGGLVAGSIVM